MTFRAFRDVLADIERACLDADKAFIEGRYDEVSTILNEQRRLTHELQLSLEDRDPAEQPYIQRRIDRIVRFRDGQLKRVEGLRDSIGLQLQSFSKRRKLAQAFNDPESPKSNLLDLSR